MGSKEELIKSIDLFLKESDISIYNTLSKKIEKFSEINKGKVKMYSCGPTVYNYAHIGNLRSYIFPDILKKLFKICLYEVNHIINFTDVGHLTDDADQGEDKMELSAKKLGKNAWEISKYYSEAFVEDLKKLNIELPSKFTKATDYIDEQIEIVKKLESNGYTYKTDDGIYFDTSKFKNYPDFGKIDMSGLKGGERIDLGDKKNITDFALWKFSKQEEQRQMEWLSPWGIGFPGWHVECSAMILAELGKTIDIHTGGTDHIKIHHTNEIAQSECSNNQKLANYWMHGEFLVLGQNERMGKSKGNFIRLQTIIDEDFSALEYRYLVLGAHYRGFLTFSYEALGQAKNSLNTIRKNMYNFSKSQDYTNFEQGIDLMKQGYNYLLNDLKIPQLLATIWEIIKSKSIGNGAKFFIVNKLDEILSLSLSDFSDFTKVQEIPNDVIELANQRLKAKQEKNFILSDELREKINSRGYNISDNKDGYEINLI